MLEWACAVAYATRREVSPSVLMAPSVIRHRAARIAANVASLADPWITPPPVALVERNVSGRPSSSCIQSTISVSTSVHAGLVTQLMPCTPRPDGQQVAEDRRVRRVGREVREEARVLPVGQAWDDHPVGVVHDRFEPVGPRWRMLGELGAHIARLTSGGDALLFDVLDVVRDPVDHLVAVPLEVLRSHPATVLPTLTGRDSGTGGAHIAPKEPDRRDSGTGGAHIAPKEPDRARFRNGGFWFRARWDPSACQGDGSCAASRAFTPRAMRHPMNARPRVRARKTR